jgi:heptosyltransferase-2
VSDRTLIISPNWIGDAVMAQPLLQLLHKQNPQGPIDVLAPSWVAPVWRAMAEVDTVIEAPFRHGKLQLRERWSFAQQLRQRGYADAYVLPNTLKFALIPWLAGIAKRVGYVGEMRYGLLNVLYRHDKKSPLPMVQFYAALAGFGDGAEVPRPVLSVSTTQIDAALQIAKLSDAARVIVFAPGAEFGSAKRWPTTHFAQLAVKILREDPDARVVILGSARDREVGDEIEALAPAVINLAGTTSLSEAIGLIAHADAVVSNDSGLLHIASALNRKIVAIYGPTDPLHAPPFSDASASLYLGLDCAPCRQRECPLGHHRCMQDIAPQRVLQAMQSLG